MTNPEREQSKLVTWGLSRSRLRDPLQPRHWLGLSKDDRDLLTAWVCDIANDISGMWTDVPVGLVPVLPADLASPSNERLVHNKWPWRIDAVIQMHGSWRIVEVKPFCGHDALGQVLAYKYYAELGIEQLKGCKMTVVTDMCCEPARAVYAAHGVELIEVGPVLGIR